MGQTKTLTKQKTMTVWQGSMLAPRPKLDQRHQEETMCQQRLLPFHDRR